MNGLRAFQYEMYLRFYFAGTRNELAAVKGLSSVPDAGNLFQFRSGEVGQAAKEIG